MNKVVLHIKIALDEMLTISNIVVTTLQGFVLPQMALLRSQMRTSVLTWSRLLPSLAKISALPSEYTVQILEGLTKCSVTIFRQTF
jgi:hypothetical protein